jgi:disulfide bond formation protein DsbB
MTPIDRSYSRILVAICGILVLLASYYFEYVKDIEPCKLCLYQRWAWGLILGISLIGCFKLLPYQSRVIDIFLTIALLIGIIISAYHSLIILGWVKETCTSDYIPKSMEEFMAILKDPKPCSKVPEVLGLPIPMLNLLISCALFSRETFILWRKNESNKRVK